MRAWDYVRIEGRVASASPVGAIDLLHRGVAVLEDAATLTPDPDSTVFAVSRLLDPAIDLTTCELRARLENGGEARHPAVPPAVLSPYVHTTSSLLDRFLEMLAAKPGSRLLEIGSRARSGVRYRQEMFPTAERTGIDVMAGDDVDIVCDAHRMSDVLPRGHFDFAFSLDVFEHLALPWKVVVELNRVVKIGAIVLVTAPQTCGMHDLPWDFWRFSDSGFRALFAPETGFEVLETARHEPIHLFPFFPYSEAFADSEKAAGFFSVSVLARKVAETSLDWPVATDALVDGFYPA